MNNLIMIKAILMIEIAVFFFGIGYYYEEYKSIDIRPLNKIDNTIENEVINLTSELASFYKYNPNNTDLYWKSKNINWTYIKEYGGVCWHYAEWYREMAFNDGYYSRTVEIQFVGKNLTHEFTVISNNDTYCVLDQINKPSCWRMKI